MASLGLATLYPQQATPHQQQQLAQHHHQQPQPLLLQQQQPLPPPQATPIDAALLTIKLATLAGERFKVRRGDARTTRGATHAACMRAAIRCDDMQSIILSVSVLSLRSSLRCILDLYASPSRCCADDVLQRVRCAPRGQSRIHSRRASSCICAACTGSHSQPR
jgi:hypothetical protein